MVIKWHTRYQVLIMYLVHVQAVYLVACLCHSFRPNVPGERLEL